MTYQPPQIQTLSLRITEDLRQRLERLRELAAVRTGHPVSLSEVARPLLESSRADRLEVADLLQESTDALGRLRRKYEAQQPLSRAEWIALAFYVRKGAEAFVHSPISRASCIALLEAFEALYPLRKTASADRDGYYIGNLPAECRPMESSHPIAPEAVRQTVRETLRCLNDPATPWRPLLAARNLYVFLTDEEIIGADALHRALRPYWPALWKLAARGHYVLHRAPVRDGNRNQEYILHPPIFPVAEGRFTLAFARREGNELYLQLSFPVPGPLGATYPIGPYPMIAESRALLAGLSPEARSWEGEQFYGCVTERGGAREFWFRAHANAITFGFSEAEWNTVGNLFCRAWAMPEVQAAWDTLTLEYGEL